MKKKPEPEEITMDELFAIYGETKKPPKDSFCRRELQERLGLSQSGAAGRIRSMVSKGIVEKAGEFYVRSGATRTVMPFYRYTEKAKAGIRKRKPKK